MLWYVPCLVLLVPLPERSKSRWLAWTKPRLPIEYGIFVGHLVAVVLALLIGIVSSIALQSALQSRAQVEQIYAHQLLEIERLWSLTLEKSAQGRAYLLTGNPERLEESNATRQAFDERMAKLLARADTPSERAALDRLTRTAADHQAALSRAFALLRAGGSRDDLAELFEAEGVAKLAAVEMAISNAALEIDTRLGIAQDNAEQAATRAIRLVILVVVCTVVLIASLTFLYFRTMQRIRRAAEENITLLMREQRARESAETARRELNETITRLDQINADFETFTGRMAQDLRNLLLPVALAPARLRHAPDDQTRERIHSSVERSMFRAHAVLEGLLAFSRAGQSPPDDHAAPVKEAIREVIKNLHPLAKATNAIVDGQAEDVQVACSPEFLRVILHHLLGNALDAVVPSAERHVWIRAHRGAGGVEIECTDTGPGIPEEAIPRIFEPFYRHPGSASPESGIGLATVKRIVATHGGRIDCVSEVGKGTSFRIWLPEVQ